MPMALAAHIRPPIRLAFLAVSKLLQLEPTGHMWEGGRSVHGLFRFNICSFRDHLGH